MLSQDLFLSDDSLEEDSQDQLHAEVSPMNNPKYSNNWNNLTDNAIEYENVPKSGFVSNNSSSPFSQASAPIDVTPPLGRLQDVVKAISTRERPQGKIKLVKSEKFNHMCSDEKLSSGTSATSERESANVSGANIAMFK